MAIEKNVNEIDKAMRESNMHVIDNVNLIRHLKTTINSRGAIMLIAPRGCHRKGQGILMYDGSIKKVEDIQVGDQLMGMDSFPRNVLELCRGNEEMAEIVPTKGKPFVVNKNHILTLKWNAQQDWTLQLGNNKTVNVNDGSNGIFDITVSEYMALPNKYKNNIVLFRTGVEFEPSHVELPIEPYFLGILLGDGCITKGVGVSTEDAEIEQEARDQAIKFGLFVRNSQTGDGCPTYFLSTGNVGQMIKNPIIESLRELNLFGTSSGTKFVPQMYKTSTKENRLAILAGLLDTDGSLCRNGFDYISKSEQLANDVVFIARSVGLAAYVKKTTKTIKSRGFSGEYFRVSISGDTKIIPTKLSRKQATSRKQIKSALHTGLQINNLPAEDYYGFCLDGDNRYLLDDFTVTHNTGKTTSTKQATKDLGLQEVYFNASMVERPDIGGYPDMFNNTKSEFISFKLKSDFQPLMHGGKVKPFTTVITAKNEDISLEVESQLNLVQQWIKKFPQIKSIEVTAISDSVANAVVSYLKQSAKVEFTTLVNPKSTNVTFEVKQADPVECVLLLDEVDKADPSVWAPLLEIVQFRSINGQKLPYLKAVIMTGNMIHEGGKRPILPLLDRCEAYMVRPSLDGFVEYSNTYKRIHPSVLSFLKDNPSALFESSDIENHYKDSTPRSMEYVSDLCFEYENRKDAEKFSAHEDAAERSIFNSRLQGFLGAEIGTNLIIYFEHYMDFLPIIRPIFEAVADKDREKGMKSVDSALDKIKKFESGTKSLVLYMTMMHNYVNHVNTMIAKYNPYNKVPHSKLAASQKKELDQINEEMTCLIDVVGYFYHRASSDVVSTSHGGNDSTMINGDLLCAILRNGVSVSSKWQEYIAGQTYIPYLSDYVKRNSTRKEFSYKSYPHLNMKTMFKSNNNDLVSYQLFDHPFWHCVMKLFSSSQKSTIEKLKALYGE